jgi:hypothetical protein
MRSITISGIFLAPPISIARLGGSLTPMESYTWAEDPEQFGAGQTIIKPEASIELSSNGSQSVYVPAQVRFRDAGFIRPVCPFLEVWCHVTEGENGKARLIPLTIDLLREQEASLANLTYEVVAANRKAARRTGDENCAYSASLAVSATDFAKRVMLASSPRAGGEPLVYEHSPLPLGAFQPARPVAKRKDGAHIRYGVDLRVIRARFTPAQGKVYGPPSATVAADPGTGRCYELVPESNRITNPSAAWNFHDNKASDATDAPPQPTFDGESDLARKGRSFGVVDDTCEVLVRARLAWNGKCLESTARIFVGPPDFAPDRRPFYSLADELSDREPSSYPIPTNAVDAQSYVFDLFRRVSETAMLINVDRYRLRLITPGSSQVEGTLPRTDGYSMRERAAGETGKDDREFLIDPVNEDHYPSHNTHLVRTGLARDRHEILSDPQALIDEILTDFELFLKIIRPPYHAFPDLPEHPGAAAGAGERRDPRVKRDRAHDMRMPPYMRDSDYAALALTPRQYDLLIGFIEDVRQGKGPLPGFLHRDRVLKRRDQSTPSKPRVSE